MKRFIRCLDALSAALLLLAAPAAAARAQGHDTPAPGAPGAPGLAIRCAKALVMPYEGPQVVDQAVLLVRDGTIETVGPAAKVVIPEGYEVLDVGSRWVMPGMIELHSHMGGSMRDLNDMVYLTNPGLRASTAVVPGNDGLKRAVAAGVTTILFIPGSGTNMGGQGVLVHTAGDSWKDVIVRQPGSLKLAQAGNPERFLFGVARSFMNWHTRNTFRRGVNYARAWEAYEGGEGSKPKLDPQFEIFRSLRKKQAQVSTHTQIYQVVLETVEMVGRELKLPVFIDHGTFDGWRAAPEAKEAGVGAALGPRAIDVPISGMIRWSGSNPERIQGVAAGYQSQGFEEIAFNTDAPVIPQEELPLQAAVGVRYGYDDSGLGAIRGLTIIPARIAGVDDRLGSLEPGKEADLVVIGGHPADPRSAVEMVFIHGRRVYDSGEGRRW